MRNRIATNRLQLALAAGMLSFSLFGCERNLKKPSKIEFSIPVSSKASTLNSNILAHVVVNIRKGGDAGIYRQANWDHPCANGDSNNAQCPKNGPPPPVPAPSFSFEVDQNSNYLVQVVAVYMDASSGGDSVVFTYGDDEQSVSSGDTVFDIRLNQIGSAANNEVMIGGRFMSSSSGGPTDRVVMTFQPPNNRPRMRIMDSIMVNGWFKFFALPGANFSYVLARSGQVIIDSLDPTPGASPSTAETPYRARFVIPDSYRERYDNSVLSSEFEEGGEIVIGYFGPAVNASPSDYKLCYTEIESDPYSTVYEDEPRNTPFKFDSMPPLDPMAFRPFGSGGDKSGSCTSGAEPHILSLEHKAYDGWLGSAFDFDSAYKLQGSGGRYTAAKVVYASGIGEPGTTASMTLEWQYLPGAKDAGAISGTEVFIVSEKFEQQFRTGEYWDCQVVYQASRDYSGQAIGPDDVVRYSTSTDNASMGSAVISAQSELFDYGLEDHEVILCPYVQNGGKQYLPGGAEVHDLYYSSPGSRLDILIAGSGADAESGYFHRSQGLGTNNFSFYNPLMVGTSNAVKILPSWTSTYSPPPGMSNIYNLILFADIDLVEARLNGGAWVDLTANCSGALENWYHNSEFYLRIDVGGLSTCSAVRGTWATASVDATLEIRYTVNAAKADSYYGLGQGNNQFTSGVYTLKSDNTCSSPTLGLVDTSSANTLVTAGNFMNEFLTTGGTDQQANYMAVLNTAGSVCLDAVNGNVPLSVPLDFVGFSGGGPSCFYDGEDLLIGEGNPFSFTIDPRDNEGQDCGLDGYTFEVDPAGMPGTYSRSFFTPDFIVHSTVPSGLAFFLANDSSPAGLGEHSLLLDSIFSSTAVVNQPLLSMYTNSDDKLTDPASDTSFPGAVDYLNSPLWPAATGQANSSLLNTSPGLAPGTYIGTVDDQSGRTGDVEVVMHGLPATESIVAMSRDPFVGGSPLFLTRDGDTWNIRHIDYGSDQLRLLAGNIGFVNQRSASISYYWDSVNSLYVILVPQGGNLLYFAADYDTNGTIQVVATESRNINSGRLIWDVMAFSDSYYGTDSVLISTDEGSSDGRLFYMPLSQYDGTAWSHPAAYSNVVTEEAGRFGDCDDNLIPDTMMGIWNANYGVMVPFDLSGGVIGYTAGYHSKGNATGLGFGEYDRFVCTQLSGGEEHYFAFRHNANTSTGRIPKIFKGYNEGADASESESFINDVNVIIEAAQFLDLDNDSFKDELVVVTYNTSTNRRLVKYYSAGAGATAYSFGGNLGELTDDPNAVIKGLWMDPYGGPPGEPRKLYLFGDEGLIYKTKLVIKMAM